MNPSEYNFILGMLHGLHGETEIDLVVNIYGVQRGGGLSEYKKLRCFTVL
jgi:hypothetical protein